MITINNTLKWHRFVRYELKPFSNHHDSAWCNIQGAGVPFCGILKCTKSGRFVNSLKFISNKLNI